MVSLLRLLASCACACALGFIAVCLYQQHQQDQYRPTFRGVEFDRPEVNSTPFKGSSGPLDAFSTTPVGNSRSSQSVAPSGLSEAPRAYREVPGLTDAQFATLQALLKGLQEQGYVVDEQTGLLVKAKAFAHSTSAKPDDLAMANSLLDKFIDGTAPLAPGETDHKCKQLDCVCGKNCQCVGEDCNCALEWAKSQVNLQGQHATGLIVQGKFGERRYPDPLPSSGPYLVCVRDQDSWVNTSWLSARQQPNVIQSNHNQPNSGRRRSWRRSWWQGGATCNGSNCG